MVFRIPDSRDAGSISSAHLGATQTLQTKWYW